MASRQWENSDARRTRATRVALRVKLLPPASEGGLGHRSQSPHSNCVWSAHRFCIVSASRIDNLPSHISTSIRLSFPQITR